MAGFFKRLFSGLTGQSRAFPPPRLVMADLEKRLEMTEAQLRAIPIGYRPFLIPKRSGGQRRILAPLDPLKDAQRRILHRLLARLPVHPAVHGFEAGRSIVTNAAPHAKKAVVLRLDLRDFFTSTSSKRVLEYFRTIGWDQPCAELITSLCTHEEGLPQGAPTSPRLSNLLNYRLDARLSAMAEKMTFRGTNPKTLERLSFTQATTAVTYTRYADDLTFSFATDDRQQVHYVIHLAKQIVQDEGYQLHLHKKLQIRRAYERQNVTGLVVNNEVNLSRSRRRWLRAVQHHLQTGRPATLGEEQIAGWRSLQGMIDSQRNAG